MKKSRILSMLIAVVFVLSTVSIPAFAATQFLRTPADPIGDPGSSNYIAPIKDHPLPHVFAAHDPDDTSKEYAYEVYYSAAPVSEDAFSSAFSIDENGLFTINPINNLLSQGVYSLKLNGKVKAYDKNNPNDALISDKYYQTLYNGLDFDFEDGVVPTGIGKAEIADENGNKYLKPTSTAAVTFTNNAPFITMRNTIITDRYTQPVVIEFSSSDLKDGFQVYGGVTTFVDSTTPGQIPGAWNDVKIVIYPRSTNNPSTYDLFMNDKLIKSKESITLTTSNQSFQSKMGNFDNFKQYSTSLGFAYDVQVSMSTETAAVGTVLTTTASEYSFPTSNVPQELQYAFFASTSENGEYEKIADGNTITLDETHDGLYIKAAARVQEIDYCDHASEWVYADTKHISYPAQAISWVTTSKVVSPVGNISYWLNLPQMPGDVFELPFEISGGKSWDEITFTAKEELGDTVSIRNVNGDNKKAILTISSGNNLSRTTSPISVNYSGGTNDTAINVAASVRTAAIKDFEDGVAIANSIIKSDGAYGNYVTCGTETSYKYRPKNSTVGNVQASYGTVAFDFDMYVGGDYNTMFTTPINWKSRVEFGEFVENGRRGYVYDKTASGKPVYVGEGWKHVKVYFDLPGAKYSIFVDGKAVTVNRYVGLVDPTKDAILHTYIDFKGETDNLCEANVTINTPGAYNAVISNAAVGKALNVDYDFFCGSFYDNKDISDVEYLICDTIDGTYTELDSDFIPGEEHRGKYVKARISPMVNYYLGEVRRGAVVETAPVKIGDVSIEAITLTVNGEVASLNDCNIAGKGDCEVVLTISASAVEATDVKFILAQYDSVRAQLSDIDVAQKTLTSEVQDVVVTLNTKANENAYFKLFILTSDGLVPVNSVINLR